MTQQQFDWTWAERMGVLHALHLSVVRVTEGRHVVGVSPTAMKSVLKALNEYANQSDVGEAFMGYRKLVASCGLSERQTKRAILALQSLSLITVEREGRSDTKNRYRLVWNELALRTQQAKCHGGTTLVVQRSAMVTERSAMVTERSAMVTTNKLETNSIEETTNYGTAEVVVSILRSLELRDPQRTYSQARNSLKLTDEQIQERIEIWRELPDQSRVPGTLNNWLTKPRSFEPQSPDCQPKLRFQKLSNADAIRRADLIAYGRKRDWSHEQLQAAVTQFENGILSPSQTMEPMPCNQQPQPGKSETNQLALVRTQHPLNRQF